jgi:phosphoglucomutase
MDANKLSICGEKSFGTGSDHIREKDGIWAVLAWLTIIASFNITLPGTGLKQILEAHFSEFGRNYFSRYDYEEVPSDGASKMMDSLRNLGHDSSFIGQKYDKYVVKICDDFAYTDPIDHSVSKNQGVRIIFEDGSRIVFRLSGTGSQGATVRLYVEKFDSEETSLTTEEAIKDLIKTALKISKLEEFTGRKTPTVIT